MTGSEFFILTLLAGIMTLLILNVFGGWQESETSRNQAANDRLLKELEKYDND